MITFIQVNWNAWKQTYSCSDKAYQLSQMESMISKFIWESPPETDSEVDRPVVATRGNAEKQEYPMAGASGMVFSASMWLSA